MKKLLKVAILILIVVALLLGAFWLFSYSVWEAVHRKEYSEKEFNNDFCYIIERNGQLSLPNEIDYLYGADLAQFLYRYNVFFFSMDESQVTYTKNSNSEQEIDVETTLQLNDEWKKTDIKKENHDRNNYYSSRLNFFTSRLKKKDCDRITQALGEDWDVYVRNPSDTEEYCYLWVSKPNDGKIFFFFAYDKN